MSKPTTIRQLKRAARGEPKRGPRPAYARGEALFYSRERWRRMRKIVLNEDPRCADPYGVHQRMGVTVLARDVDHIVPLRVAPDRAYERSNLQPLCPTCHARKTREDQHAVR